MEIINSNLYVLCKSVLVCILPNQSCHLQGVQPIFEHLPLGNFARHSFYWIVVSLDLWNYLPVDDGISVQSLPLGLVVGDKSSSFDPLTC